MKRWLGPLLVMLVTALSVHWLALSLAPTVIMGRALAVLAERGVALHAFTAQNRVTPQSQQVVRSSPDLYYALCRYDLSPPEYEPREAAAPRLTVQMAQWDGYQSLSFFDAQTNNFATIRGTGKAVRVVLQKGGSGNGESGADRIITTPTDTGVILIRRLAPTAEAFAKAAASGKGDACAFSVSAASAG